MSSWKENLRLPAPGVRYGERLLPQVVDESALADPNRILGMIPKSTDTSKGWYTLTTKQLSHCVNYAAWWIEGQVGRTEDIETIAYLATNDFRYWVLELAAIKCGYRTLLLSPRNSASNNIKVLEATDCKTIFHTSDKAAQISKIQREKNDFRCILFPSMDELQHGKVTSPYPYNKSWDSAKDDHAIIVHTSGSTGAPKPVFYSHRFLGVFDLDRMVPDIQGRSCGGLNIYGDSNTAFLVASPMFHLSGLASSLAPLWAGSTMILPPADIPPSASIVLDMMRDVDVHTVGLPPSIWEDLVSECAEDFLKVSKHLKYVIYGGGPLARDTGNWLSERFFAMNGIGSSETGLLHSLVPEKEDWEYFEWHPTHIGFKMDPIGDDQGLHEMVIHRDPRISQFQGVFITQPDIDVWRTRDLFEKHPTKNMWKFRGRRDDVIVLSNGEKFNPVTMEGIISGDPLVSGALVVGLRRTQCSLLLEVRGKNVSSSLIDKIWPTVERANLESPGHAQIARNMILVLAPERSFKRAGKGTILRSVALQDFAAEIDKLYEDADSTTIERKLPSLDYRPDDRLKKFIRELLKFQQRDLSLPSDNHDLFNLGFDSLQATQLSNNLRAALKNQVSSKRKITPKLIYENPTVQKLARALQTILDQESNIASSLNGVNGTQRNDKSLVKTQEASETDRLAHMEKLVNKFSAAYVSRGIGKNRVAKTGPLNVLVTGTTGSLGHYLVEALLADQQVHRVYCFNRAASAEATFMERTKTYNSSRVEFFQVLFGAADFGIEKKVFDRLRNEVDVIIHNAWKVDFNHSLESFVDAHIQGVDNFISWCLGSFRQPALYFVSSISSMGCWSLFHDTPTPEHVTDDYLAAAPSGYGMSKYVAERMLESASRAGVRAFIFRVGQISGPVRILERRWNDTEWFPSLVKTSKALKMVPSSIGTIGEVDWIPIDILTDAMIEIIHSTESTESKPGAQVFNLINPQEIKFDTLAQVIKEMYSIEMVPYETWVRGLELLEQTPANLSRYPALKLLDFFVANDPQDDSLKIRQRWETRCSEEASQTVQFLEPASADDMRIWIEQWAY